jgi:hypothetical protein
MKPVGAPYRCCAACQEQIIFFDTARVPCGHKYCRDCLQDLFRASLTDESLFPPRCSRQPIASGGVRIFLTSELIEQYKRKKVEFVTSDRTYCSNPICSALMSLEKVINDVATYTDCGTKACTMCKTIAHTGDCPLDTALQQVLETANENGWQRCYSCRRIVELDHGCNHMFVYPFLLITIGNNSRTCHCGAQFCYICGLRWLTCWCAQWNEDRLYARAN